MDNLDPRLEDVVFITIGLEEAQQLSASLSLALQRLERWGTEEHDAHLQKLEEFREAYREGCSNLRIDYVPLDTSMPFDKALTEYLIQRQSRF